MSTSPSRQDWKALIKGQLYRLVLEATDDILFMVIHEEITAEDICKRIDKGAKNYGAFRPDRINWGKEFREEVLDLIAYKAGSQLPDAT